MNDPSTKVDVVVVGGGIVGLASARALVEAEPGLRVVVLEAEAGVGRHQSSHNSGVLHAGVYYLPGSAKAELCRAGAEAMRQFCEEHGIPVVQTGKLVVAVDRSELTRFDALVERATANRVPGLRVLGPDEMVEIEPHVVGLRALHSPSTAVVDFGAVCRALADELDVLTGHRVMAIEERADGVRVRTSARDIEAGTVVVCAGLGAEVLAAAAGCPTDLRIVPFRGSFTELSPEGADLVRGSIYPVPDPTLPFLGVPPHPPLRRTGVGRAQRRALALAARPGGPGRPAPGAVAVGLDPSPGGGAGAGRGPVPAPPAAPAPPLRARARAHPPPTR
jgi:L-2-hydroxyglutarate oxidase